MYTTVTGAGVGWSPRAVMLDGALTAHTAAVPFERCWTESDVGANPAAITATSARGKGEELMTHGC